MVELLVITNQQQHLHMQSLSTRLSNLVIFTFHFTLCYKYSEIFCISRQAKMFRLPALVIYLFWIFIWYVWFGVQCLCCHTHICWMIRRSDDCDSSVGDLSTRAGRAPPLGWHCWSGCGHQSWQRQLWTAQYGPEKHSKTKPVRFWQSSRSKEAPGSSMPFDGKSLSWKRLVIEISPNEIIVKSRNCKEN